MSLFKPSNLSPNFEEVVYNHPLNITFQINTNGSVVTAYKVEILQEYNNLYDADKDIIGTIYGYFSTPLYNKDIATIILTPNELRANNIILEANRNYRWRVRVYDKDIFDTVPLKGAGLYYTKDPDICCQTFINPFQDDPVRIIFDFGRTINGIRQNENLQNWYVIVSQKDPAPYFTHWSTKTYENLEQAQSELQMYVTSATFYRIEDYVVNYKTPVVISISDGLCPTMYFYLVMIMERTDTSQYAISISGEENFNIMTYNGTVSATIQYYNIPQNIQINSTYVGSGNVVGSTKQIMWTKDYNASMKRNSYVRITWLPAIGNFTPFVKSSEINNAYIKAIPYLIEDNTVYVERKYFNEEYIKNLSNGKFYMAWVMNDTLPELLLASQVFPIFATASILKNNINYLTFTTIEELQDELNRFSETTSIASFILVYIQQEKIVQVDKNIGMQNLNKITFDKPFDYNPIHSNINNGKYDYGNTMQCGLVSADFDYDRVYITPVEEFDNTDTFSYINIVANASQLLDDIITVSGDKEDIDAETYPTLHKIINYVSSTGEVTLYNQLEEIPTIQHMYQIYQRNASNKKQYDLIAGSKKGADEFYLGGKPKGNAAIYSNHSETFSSMEGIDYQFDYLFVQPNYAIKDDMIVPMHIEVYNHQYKESVYLMNDYDGQGRPVEIIDRLDESMWLLCTKNIVSAVAELGYDSANDVKYNIQLSNDTRRIPTMLELPQTPYKIYTNFVDSIPEGYFYCRYDKNISFQIYNLNNKNEFISIEDTVSETSVPYRDLLIKATCQDIDADGTLLGTNYVTIKNYKYEILSNNLDVIYDSDELYDGKLEYKFRGCANNTQYYIKIYIEDNYGKLFTAQSRIRTNYVETIDQNNITISPICEEQAIHLQFSPVKRIKAIGDIINTFNDTIQIGQGGLLFKRTEDASNNTIELPNDFSYIYTFTLNENIILDQNIHLINRIVTQNTTDELQDQNIYEVYFDSRSYTIEEGIYKINASYMQILCYKNQKLVAQHDILPNAQKINLQFAYILQKENSVVENYIYITPASLTEINEVDREQFVVPDSCINTDGTTLKMVEDQASVPEDDIYLIDNPMFNNDGSVNEDYFINRYISYIKNMSYVNCVISNIGTTTSCDLRGVL